MLRLFNPDGTQIGVIEQYESLEWTHRWREPGEFVLHVYDEDPYSQDVTRGRLLVLEDSPEVAGVIRYRSRRLDEFTGESGVWEIRGGTLQSVLGQRIVLGATSYSGSAETIMKSFVDAQLVNPTDPDRKIDQMSIATDQLRGGTIAWPPGAYQNVSEILRKISESQDLGWDVHIQWDPWAWVFDIYEGVDRSTINNDGNAPVIFSIELDNLREQEYTEDGLSYRSVVIVGGQGSGAERTLVQVGGGTGFERFEDWVDARDTDDTNALTSRGNQRLAEADMLETLSAQIFPFAQFKYREDYNLGDKVTLRAEGQTLHRRITSVVEEYRSGQPYNLQVSFGSREAGMQGMIRRIDDDPVVESGGAVENNVTSDTDRIIHVSTAEPTAQDGADGDIWLRYE